MPTPRVPRSLGQPPLVEAIFELRFEPSQPAAGELLPGLLYQHFASSYPEASQLPLGELPSAVRENEALRYQPTHRLAGKTGIIQVGHRVAFLSCPTPYPGWNDFRSRVSDLVTALGSTQLVTRVERFSFRFLNVIPAESEHQLSLLNTEMILMGQPVPEHGFQLRVEIQQSPLTTIVQLRTGTVAKLPDGSERTGLMVDVDTICAVQHDEFWNNTAAALERSHSELKRIFFSVLKTEVIETFVPVWD